MRSLVFPLVLAALASGCATDPRSSGAGDSEQTKSGDVRALQGKWKMIARFADDEPVKAGIGSTFLDIDGETMAFRTNDDEPFMTAVFTLRSGASPKEIDVRITSGESRHQRLGVYETDGDKFKLCLGGEDDYRPAGLRTKKGESAQLFEYERVR